MKYEAYNSGDSKKTKRTWAVWENDGSEDGRLVASQLTEADCKRIVNLLNEDEAKQ